VPVRLRLIWHLLADLDVRFTDLGPGWHDEQAGRDRKIAVASPS
jgi:hypothetical protein